MKMLELISLSIWKSVQGFAYGEILGKNTQLNIYNNMLFDRSTFTEYLQLNPQKFFNSLERFPSEEDLLPNPMFGARINSIIYEHFMLKLKETNQQNWSMVSNNFVTHVFQKSMKSVGSKSEFESFVKCCPDMSWIYGYNRQSENIYYNTMQYMFPLAAYLSQTAIIAYQYEHFDYFGDQIEGKLFDLNLFISAFDWGDKLSKLIFPTDMEYSVVSVITGLFCGILVFLAFPNYNPDFNTYQGSHDPNLAMGYLKNILNKFIEVIRRTNIITNESRVIFDECFEDIYASLYTETNVGIFSNLRHLTNICFGVSSGLYNVSICDETLHYYFRFILIAIDHLTHNSKKPPDLLLEEFQRFLYGIRMDSSFLLSIIGGLIGLIIKENNFTLLDEQYKYLNKDEHIFDLKQFRKNMHEMFILLDKTMISTRENVPSTEEGRQIPKAGKMENTEVEQLDNVFNVLLGFNAGLVYGDFSKNGLGNMVWRFTQKNYSINEALFNNQAWLNILGEIYDRDQWDTPENYKLFDFFTPVCVPYLSYWPITNVSKNQKKDLDDNVIISFFFLRQQSNETDLPIGDVSSLLFNLFYSKDKYLHDNALKFGDMPCIHFKLNILRYLQEFWVKRSKFYDDPTIFVCGLKDLTFVRIHKNELNLNYDVPTYKYDKFLQEAKSLCKTNQKNCGFGFFNRLEQFVGRIPSNYDTSDLMGIFDQLGKMPQAHKMSTISEIHYIIPYFNYFMILEYLFALKHDDPKWYLDSVIEDPINNSRSCFSEIIDIMYDITMQHKIMDLYALFIYILRKFVHDKSPLDVNEYIEYAVKTSSFKSGLVAEENESRERKMLDYSELVDNVDGEYEMYILGCFIHDLKDIHYKPLNEHDVFMKYLVKYSGVRRGILGPLLGAIYGLFVTCNSGDPTSVFEKMGDDRNLNYNNILADLMNRQFSSWSLDEEKSILQSLTQTIIKYNFN